MKKTTLTAIALALGIAVDVNASVRPDRYTSPCYFQTPVGLVQFAPMDQRFMPEGEWVQDYINTGYGLQQVSIFIPTYPEEETYPKEESYDERPAHERKNKRRNREQRGGTFREEYSSRRSEKTPETYISEKGRFSYKAEVPMTNNPYSSVYDPSVIRYGVEGIEVKGGVNYFTEIMSGIKYWDISGCQLNWKQISCICKVVSKVNDIEILDLRSCGIGSAEFANIYPALLDREASLTVILEGNEIGETAKDWVRRYYTNRNITFLF